MSLRYPADGFSGDADYVSFKPMKYSSRGSSGGGGGGYIILYMPESLPAIQNSNNWQEFTFGAGPMGGLAEDFVDEVMNLTHTDFTKPMTKSDYEKGIDRIKGKIDEQLANIGPLARQAALQGVAGGMKTTANHLLSVKQGQIYNPNIELAYTGPGLRTFSFRFKMVPKSQAEATAINNIILQFKKESAPKAVSGGMYEIPKVWQVTYMSGGGQNQYQNKFKPAACTSVVVQDNVGVGYYSAHKGGAAIETSLTLTFMEVDVITRDDHTGLRGM